MAVKKVKPTSPGRRFQSFAAFEEITKTTPEKSLLRILKKSGGRNVNGRITSRRRGGGHKRYYRIIDFKRDKEGIPATVATIEYDPNRSARIALLNYADGEKRYIIAPLKLSVGDTVMAGPEADIQPGNALPLANIPLGTHIHNIELRVGKGGQIVRSAGNAEHGLVKLGKAGRNRWKGRRPKVRGVAMNPVDHPMGGGEGRSSGGRHPCSPWGVPTKGYRTRKNKRTDRFIVKRRTK